MTGSNTFGKGIIEDIVISILLQAIIHRIYIEKMGRAVSFEIN